MTQSNGSALSSKSLAFRQLGKRDRLQAIFAEIVDLPPTNCGLLLYAQIANLINAKEDEVWGKEHWAPPRSFLNGNRTERIYPILPESFHPVSGYPGTTLLLAKGELIFISRHGALQIQRKVSNDSFGEELHFSLRLEHIFLDKADASGHGVWHHKNRQT